MWFDLSSLLWHVSNIGYITCHHLTQCVVTIGWCRTDTPLLVALEWKLHWFQGFVEPGCRRESGLEIRTDPFLELGTGYHIYSRTIGWVEEREEREKGKMPLWPQFTLCTCEGGTHENCRHSPKHSACRGESCSLRGRLVPFIWWGFRPPRGPDCAFQFPLISQFPTGAACAGLALFKIHLSFPSEK